MDNRVALVTGAGSGIGRGCALALQGAGFNVVLAGRTLSTLETTANMAAPGGARMVPFTCDVAVAGNIKMLFQAIGEEFGRLDVLFNNAGIGTRPVDPDELDIEEWDQAVSVNLSGSYYCAREAFRMMKSQCPTGGRIINNGSISAHAPRPNSTAYTATKHAITGLTKSLSLDGRAYNIACSQIDIGNADTGLVDAIKQGAMQASGQVQAEPVIEVEHVAGAVAYIASLPLHVNVQFMTLMATNMPFVGRG